MGRLTGKNAFVTGTSQGIGASISKSLIEEGCNICMHYFHSPEEPERLKKLAESRNQRAIIVKADLTDEQDAVRCVKECADFLVTFDVLVNNSGGSVQRRFLAEIDSDYWQRVLDINLKTMMLITRESLPNLNQTEGSSIINVASLAGRGGGHPGSLVYAATKGAMLTWSRALARELAARGIRVIRLHRDSLKEQPSTTPSPQKNRQ